MSFFQTNQSPNHTILSRLLLGLEVLIQINFLRRSHCGKTPVNTASINHITYSDESKLRISTLATFFHSKNFRNASNTFATSSSLKLIHPIKNLGFYNTCMIFSKRNIVNRRPYCIFFVTNHSCYIG